ncbi:MAG: hypothetical protein JST67_11875 [Bacteroidetes bacterium]|nr:hypothetical protein [Bacteroidota bacterium]
MILLRRSIFFLSVCGISATGLANTAVRDSLGLPGDNLNLYGVLYLFKQSTSVENFEQLLNTPSNKVNNLDLNHDGQTDYIRVVDYGKNGLHSLVLQDPISATEAQDLAVVEVEQKGNGTVHIQIVGDEDLYGPNYVIEPQDENNAQQNQQQQAPPQQQQAPAQYNTYNTYNNYGNGGGYGNGGMGPMMNVWNWGCVQFMYGSGYSYWNSPWSWGSYPTWWSPWRPMYYGMYWNSMNGYMMYQRRVYVNRLIAANSCYYRYRQTSPTVRTNITNNVYINQYNNIHRGANAGAAGNLHPNNPNNPAGGHAAPGFNPNGNNNTPKQISNSSENNGVNQREAQHEKPAHTNFEENEHRTNNEGERPANHNFQENEHRMNNGGERRMNNGGGERRGGGGGGGRRPR